MRGDPAAVAINLHRAVERNVRHGMGLLDHEDVTGALRGEEGDQRFDGAAARGALAVALVGVAEDNDAA